MMEGRILVSTPPCRAYGPEAIRSAYQNFMQKQDPSLEFKAPLDIRKEYGDQQTPPRLLGDVAVVGAGMAGFKAAMSILDFDLGNVTMFEADDRIGGRLFTYYFDKEHTVYFEAGGMRIPEAHLRVKKTLDFLEGKGHGLSTTPYIMENKASRVFVNGKRNGTTAYTLQEVTDNPELLGFGYQNSSADTKLASVLDKYVCLLQNAQKVSDEAFQAAFDDIVQKFDNLSLRQFLQEKADPPWTEKEIVFVESMSDQTNAYHVSFVEQLMDSFEFASTKWYTIKGGMQQLPLACQRVCEDYNKGADVKRYQINMSTCLEKLETVRSTAEAATADEHKRAETEKVRLHLRDSKGHTRTADFDIVLLAIPQAALRMIETPQWSVEREYAIRALRYDPIRKIGLEFRTRWWEHLPKNPIKGGQSITDLPSRWVVYPSDVDPTDGRGHGALLCYAWSNDAYALLSLPACDLERIALRDLQLLHGDQVNIHEQFVKSYHKEWSLSRAGGIAFFLPGQWKDVFGKSLCPEGNVYFAGEHLSKHHAWVEGALDSAQQAVQQMSYDAMQRRGASFVITEHGSEKLFADVL